MMLKEKVAIITGSGKGIGKSIALAFAKEGCNVVLVARTESDIRKVGKECETFGIHSLPIKADVRSVKDVKRLVEITIKEFGKIDFLVNNAGVWYFKPLHKSTIEEINEQIDTNLKGLIYCTRFVLPYMVKQRDGIIVNISSGAGHYAFADLAVYCATKFGVNAITKSLAKEVERFGIDVYSVCPGFVATPGQEKFMGKAKFTVAKHVMIKPEKIAKKVLELCTEKIKSSSGSCADVYF
jgi:3-oxoacyl-[acyl-carrier protein] reductase